MRNASRLESNSVNNYINNISVDTGTSFYNKRGDRRMTIISIISAFIFGLCVREWIHRHG